jgi:hypothetical protein
LRYLVSADSSVGTNGTLLSDPPPREQPFMPVIDDIPGIPAGSHHREPAIALHSREGTIWRASCSRRMSPASPSNRTSGFRPIADRVITHLERADG